MSCENCYDLEGFPLCLDTLIVRGLNLTETYTVNLTNSASGRRTLSATADVNGEAEFDLTELDQTFLVQSRAYRLSVSDSNGNPVVLNIDGEPYTCMWVRPVNIVPTPSTFTIGE